MGTWLIADSTGTVTAHRGLYVGPGGPWDLADALIPGSYFAVQPPALNGHYQARPEAYRQLLANHEAARQCLLVRHGEAVAAGNLYATVRLLDDSTFVGLLLAAVGDRGTQLVLHDWLAEVGFPHVDELRLKKWNKGHWTEGQLLDLLSKPFASTRRSFSGRSV